MSTFLNTIVMMVMFLLGLLRRALTPVVAEARFTGPVFARVRRAIVRHNDRIEERAAFLSGLHATSRGTRYVALVCLGVVALAAHSSPLFYVAALPFVGVCRRVSRRLLSRVDFGGMEMAGGYIPAIFKLANFDKVEFVTVEEDREGDPIRDALMKRDYSFAYLREGEVRLIRAYRNGELVTEHAGDFGSFLSALGLAVSQTGLFKTGKYLSRIFRPTRYWGVLKNVDIFVNTKMVARYGEAALDGLSPISVSMAKAMGLRGRDAEHGASGQLTLVGPMGLVKGHYVVIEGLGHDVVVYGQGNIKTEVRLDKGGLFFAAAEPVKLSPRLRLDVQTLLNVHQHFGLDQILVWAEEGIKAVLKDIVEGRVAEWFDDASDLKPSDFADVVGEGYQTNNRRGLGFTLQAFIRRGGDYRQFPNMTAAAWNLFRAGLRKMSRAADGKPVYRIPVIGGCRAYVRTDVRAAGRDGDFEPTVARGTSFVDERGNWWIHPLDAAEILSRHGGADLDDGFAFIRLVDGRSFVYRSPNQFGECGVYKVAYAFEAEAIAELHREVEMEKKKAAVQHAPKPERPRSRFESVLALDRDGKFRWSGYTVQGLLYTHADIRTRNASIGQASYAEMVLGIVRITDEDVAQEIMRAFLVNLERIIDATVKDGVDCRADMESVKARFEAVIEWGIKMPQAALHYFPDHLRGKVRVADDHPLDQFLNEVEALVKEAELFVMGEGSANTDERVPGLIDRIQVPFVELATALASVPGAVEHKAIEVHRAYNTMYYEAFEAARTMSPAEADKLIEATKAAARRLVYETINNAPVRDRVHIVRTWALKIYGSKGFVHDSILWLPDLYEQVRLGKNVRRGKRLADGTARYMIELLESSGIIDHLDIEEADVTEETDELFSRLFGEIFGDLDEVSRKSEDGLRVVRRREVRELELPTDGVRLWLSKDELRELVGEGGELVPELFEGFDQLVVDADGTALLSSEEVGVFFHLGDETPLPEGEYRVHSVHAAFRGGRRAKNSIAVLLA